jgi:histidine triad (HIT) family protein
MQSQPTDDCAFCRIIDGSDTDAQIVGEGKDWLAFFPLHPATKGHTLVVPRAHVRDFWSADTAMAASLSAACIEVGRGLERVLAPDGMNLITSAGRAAEQTVFHLHFHIVPRWHNDNVDPIWPPASESSDRASEALVQAARRALASAQGV